MTNLIHLQNQFQFCLIIMKYQQENSFQLPKDWHESLRTKYQQMSALQLKKAKISMVKDLEQINLLLDEVISAENRNQPQSIEDIQREINKNKKIQKSLQKSLDNFQFMLTGDYSVRADQEILRIGKQIKVLREEISKFNRMLSVPMEKDIEICQELQKQLFQIEKNVEEAKVKNFKKKQRIKQISSKISSKINGIKVVNKQIEKKAEDSEYEDAPAATSQDIQKYKDLIVKRNKLTNIHDREEKRYQRQYQQKIKKYRDIQEASVQIQRFLMQIQKSLEERLEQLKKIKQRNGSLIKKHRKSDVVGLTQRKIKTEQNSQAQGVTKKVSKRSSRLVSEVGQIMPRPKFESFQNNSRIDSSENLLPRLYKALGKSKLDIEQDCDLKDLLYI